MFTYKATEIKAAYYYPLCYIQFTGPVIPSSDKKSSDLFGK